MTELALRENDAEVIRDYNMTVKQSASNLLTLINDLLDFSKIEQGRFEIVPTDYYLSSLIDGVISIINIRALESHIRFVVNTDSNIPDALYGDEARIRQILLNILGNAVKFTEKGFVSFSIGQKIRDVDTVDLVFEVEDSGIGIKPQDIEDIFNAYSQVKGRYKSIEGTGLGLAITKRMVDAMGGSICVVSEYGKGSIFTVTLPQKIRSHDILAPVNDPGNKHVLIYENRERQISSLVRTLENMGVNCSVVKNDYEFLDKLMDGGWTHLFVSAVFYKNVRRMFANLKPNLKIVLLTRADELIPDKDVPVIFIPAYSVAVANILNDSANASYDDEAIKAASGFTAPEVKVLIVDDINNNLRVAEGLMKPYKMQIDLCESGEDAIEAIKNTQYDLIFMDHKMPGMDGVETTLRIREMGKEDSRFCSLPIIALTANAVSGMKEMFLSNGFNDFISKPISTAQLNVVLKRWIPKSKQK